MARIAKRGGTVGDVATAMDRFAPPSLAQEWDNVGLLVGDRRASVSKTLLCIDLTPAVLAEAVEVQAEVIIAYHPPIFRPMTRLLADGTGMEAVVHRTIALGMAIYSPHTALDAADGGTNDVLAAMSGLKAIEPFEFVEGSAKQCKLVTFVPEEHLEKVAEAMFAVGAGRIGEYEQCSYRVRGEGTFFGTESTSPRVGKKGRLERVPEVRLEMVTPAARLPEVVAALRSSHPYEEPAFDIHPLTAEPARGIGRVGPLPAGTTLQKLARTLKQATGSKVATIVGAPGTKLARAAVCVGAAGRLPLERPRSAKCDVIVTGEIRHHDALSILRTGKTAIALGHWESERPVLAPLAKRLQAAVAGVTFVVSRRDCAPCAAV